MIAELRLGGNIQTVFGADAVPRPAFSNTTFLYDVNHYGLMETSIQLLVEESHCLWSAPNQSRKSVFSTNGIQVGAERVSSALMLWILDSILP